VGERFRRLGKERSFVLLSEDLYRDESRTRLLAMPLFSTPELNVDSRCIYRNLSVGRTDRVSLARLLSERLPSY